MYTPTLFREDDPARHQALIEAHDFGTLIIPTVDGIEIAHLPFLFERFATGGARLRAQVALGNRVGRLAAEGRPVTVVFHGPHAYVSAAWYEAPARQVPTWNYAVVHVHGRLVGPMNESELRTLVSDLAAKHEGSAARWKPEQTDAGAIESLLPGIVGFRVEIERMEGKFKLSQNRSPADQARVIAAFEKRRGPDDLELAGMMTERLSKTVR
jgi:transcriptional regulator